VKDTAVRAARSYHHIAEGTDGTAQSTNTFADHAMAQLVDAATEQARLRTLLGEIETPTATLGCCGAVV